MKKWMRIIMNVVSVPICLGTTFFVLVLIGYPISKLTGMGDNIGAFALHSIALIAIITCGYKIYGCLNNK